MTQNLSSFLNISRWLAALLVVVGHVRHLILVDFKAVEQKTIIFKAIYFVTGLGHEAVVIFFVISGFLVGSLTLKRWQSDGPNIRAYATARICRIYTVLVPALIVGLTLDLVGMQWLNASELYTNSTQYNTVSLNQTISATVDLPTFVGNFFMMQNILVGTLGSNAPLWSLAYEWWYYCIFALLGIALTGRDGRSRIICGLSAIFISIVLPKKLMLWGIIWLLGIGIHIWISLKLWRPHPLFGLTVFIFAIIASRMSHNIDNVANQESMITSFIRDFMLGFAYCIAMVSISKMTTQLAWPRFNEWLAEFSYSTYLFHFPAMLFVVAAGYQFFDLRFQVQPSMQGVMYFLTVTAVVYIYCYALSLLTERYTNTLRRKLNSYFSASEKCAVVPAENAS